MNTGNPHNDRQTCPNCGSSNLTVIAEHEPDGYNGYKCEDCGCTFGN